MTDSLNNILLDFIQQNGEIPFSDYMNVCLQHPDYGFYIHHNPFEKNDSDFFTAPQISQMFGEMIGLWCFDTWEKLNNPQEFNILDLGGGTGALMDDILRTLFRLVPASVKIKPHIVESSPLLKKVQSETLKKYGPIHWHETLSFMKDLTLPTIIVANEFFDALPVDIFTRYENHWTQKCVGIQNKKLNFIEKKLDELPDVLTQHPLFSSIGIEDQLQISQAVDDVITLICYGIKKTKGAILIVDYGQHAWIGETAQALKSHEKVDLLSEPGHADITAHVDFSHINRIASKMALQSTQMVTQRQFLRNMGIEFRFQQLVKSSPSSCIRLSQDIHRLLSPLEMGSLFKVMSVHTPHLFVTGFDQESDTL